MTINCACIHKDCCCFPCPCTLSHQLFEYSLHAENFMVHYLYIISFHTSKWLEIDHDYQSHCYSQNQLVSNIPASSPRHPPALYSSPFGSSFQIRWMDLSICTPNRL